MKARQAATQRSGSTSPDQIGLMIYAFALAALGIAALMPASRIWGFNWWGYFPAWGIGGWLLLGIALAVASRTLSRFGVDSSDLYSSQFWIFSGGTVGLLIIGSVLLPSSTYFSGDGYQLLSRLADGRSIAKDWDFGSTALIESVHRMLGGSGEPGALKTYRSIAIIAGVLASIFTLLLVRRLPFTHLQRFLFVLGMLTGGYMLMFFGHVENYSLLVAVVLIYSLAGYLVAINRLSAFWLIPILILALVLHLIAVALVPSFLLLLIRKNEIFQRIREMVRARRLPMIAGAVIVGVIFYHLIQQNVLFLQFALLPVIPDRFAVEGEWLFSPKHLVDILNLIILLSPMSLLLLVRPWGKKEPGTSEHSTLYLRALVLGTLGMVFVMRSGIGMPRDWDLFAIAGPPLVLATLATLFRWGGQKKWLLPVIGLAISLNLVLLIPRIVVNVTDEIAVQHFRAYLDLDFIRGRNARKLLVNYYRQHGQAVAADREQARAEGDYPESRLAQQAAGHVQAGRFKEASEVYWRVIDMNPLFSDAWANIGACYMQLGKLDSAYQLAIVGNHINPNNLQTVNILGVVCTRLGRLDEAEKWLARAEEIDSAYWRGIGNRALLRMKQGRPSDALNYLRQVAAREDSPAEYIRTLADSLIALNATAEAVEGYRLAILKGLDAQVAESLKTQYPLLQD